jgi:hypothetical protein
MYWIVSAATSRSICRKRILTQSRMTTKSWFMLPRMTMRSRRFWRATTGKYSSTTPCMRSRQKGGRYEPVRQVASVLWRAHDRLPEHVRGGIGLLRRQVRTRQPTHRSRIVVFGWDHAFKAERCTLQALLSIPAAPLHVEIQNSIYATSKNGDVPLLS